MKNHVKALVAVLAVLSSVPAYSQPSQPRGGMGGPGGGPDLGGAMAKLFGDNKAFSATLQIETANPSGAGENMSLTGSEAFDNGKTRFEMDMSSMKGSQMPAGHMAQMKSMGMDKVVSITRPDQKSHYLVYPGLQAYVEIPVQNSEFTKPESDFKVEITELGKDTVEGHPCIKNKAVVTDDQGNKHEATLWNATDLNKFPIKIETTEQGHKMTLLFKDVKLSKPDASLFEPPSDYKKYDNFMSMMMQHMQGMHGGMMGQPPAQPQQP
jgi:Domain of unknown function (DUF4412)